MQRNSTPAQLIYEIGQLEARYIHTKLKSYGLNMDHARLMKFVKLNSGTNQKTLGAYLQKQPGTLTNMIKHLESLDYIIRRSSAKGINEKEIYLLPKGESALREITIVFSKLDQIVGSQVNINSGEFENALKSLADAFNDSIKTEC